MHGHAAHIVSLGDTPPDSFKHTEIIAAVMKASGLTEGEVVTIDWETTYNNGLPRLCPHDFKLGEDELYGGFGPLALPLSSPNLAERGQWLRQVSFTAKFKPGSKAEVRIELLMVEYY